LWEIVDDTEEPPLSNVDLKVKKDYDRRVRKAFSIICCNLVDRQLAHICGFKRPTKAWRRLCNIHETKSLSNVLFIRCKFFTCNMQEDEDMLDHINKVKGLTDQLACLEVPVTNGDVVMTLLENLLVSYVYLIYGFGDKTHGGLDP